MKSSVGTVGAVGSVSAAVLHAAAVGIHTDLASLALVFTVLAIAQFVAGVAAFGLPNRGAAAVLGGVNLAALGGWFVTRSVGVGWIDGLQTPEPPQTADTAAALLALLAVGTALWMLSGHRQIATAWLPPSVAVATLIVSVGLVTITRHDHAGHATADHATADHATAEHGEADHAAADHAPTRAIAVSAAAAPPSATDAAPTPATNDTGAHATDHADDHTDGHAPATPVPYDPALPIDLGGVEGVTDEQQAFAENLVAVTLRYLPAWADLDAVAEAGFHSIQDGGTGYEHYIQWDWIDDDVWLDPTKPESLVFQIGPGGTKELVSAMYMLPTSTTLDEVPDWGGELMQWHEHGDLCFTDDPVAPRVAGVKPLGTPCAPPLVDLAMAPMIHVWIRPHPCGPFAALEGVAGGQVPEGETILCDVAHGSH